MGTLRKPFHCQWNGAPGQASGREIDFACSRVHALSELVQVTLSLADPQIRQRERDALTEAMKEQKLD